MFFSQRAISSLKSISDGLLNPKITCLSCASFVSFNASITPRTGETPVPPATTTHSQCTEEELLDQGIKPNTIRLSIGTENIDDIIQDLDEAFKAVQ